jgi:hypothetical protein
MLVTNNAYRLGPVPAAGTRPRLDSGRLGVIDFRPPDQAIRSPGAPWRQLRVGEIEIAADGPLPLGVDGEAITLEPPLQFSSRPGALRVLIADHHPGASPSSSMPIGLLGSFRALGFLAAGRAQPPASD